jgi:D-beta-D-heptose 7-phosphate kinase/D-beta-D-heptose 1-phosphate adenosyltransferase
MLDEYQWGDVQRVSPEAPVVVVQLRERTVVPGGAANTAANVAALGGSAELAGVIGRDAPARDLVDALRPFAVACAGMLVDEGRPTTVKTRVMAQHHQVVRLDRESTSPIPASLEHALSEWLKKRISDAGCVVLSDYDKGVVTAALAQQAVALARDRGIPIVVDPKGNDFSKYRGATVVTPNLSEACRAAGCDPGTFEDLPAASRTLRRVLGESALLVTCGARGMSLFRRAKRPMTVTSEARQVFDVTGAGDTVVAAVALALAAGLEIADAARLANRAAGLAVARLGTTTLSAAELLATLP